jgi:hypothetical protein
MESPANARQELVLLDALEWATLLLFAVKAAAAVRALSAELDIRRP